MIPWQETLRRARGLYIILFLLSLINLSVCIYEDQIGKFDWRQTYVGRIKFARFDTLTAARRIIVATEENVVAALNLKTGQVVWRHMLESAGAGELQLLHVSDTTITVSGDNPYMVRGWDSATGLMKWEWSMLLNSEYADLSQWFVHQSQLIHVLPVVGKHIEISSYNVKTGFNRGQSLKLSASWVNEGCILTAQHYICVSGEYGSKFIFSIDITNTDRPVMSKPLSKYIDWGKSEGVLYQLDGANVVPGFLVDNILLIAMENDFKLVPVEMVEGASVSIVDSVDGLLLVQTYFKDRMVHIQGNQLENGSPAKHISSSAKLALRNPIMSASLCTGEQRACRFLVTASDDSSTLITQNGQVVWTREEALANIVAVEFVDLPVSELDAAIETEFDPKEGDIFGAFVRRISSQAQQLATSIHSLLKLTSGHEVETDKVSSSRGLVRDDLDLHKMILAVTAVGKIFGIDNLSGAILWSRNVPSMATDRQVLIFVQRSARHPPHEPRIAILATKQGTGNGLLITLNPITGALSSVQLDYKLKQAAILPKADAEHLHALILLDEEDSVQVVPMSASRLVKDFYMFVADQKTTRVTGFALKYDGREVVATKTWSLVLGGSESSGARIVRIVPKSPHERVHSHGKVMGDRSVLYKYINPNLVLFVTEGPDPVHKDVVHMLLIDAVSGAVVTSQSHKRARATAHAVHAGNQLAYAYYNDKHRRTEIATVELYEGPSRSLPAGAAFSSLAVQSLSPLVERQTYILPATLSAMVDTVTEKGITDKHILLSLTSGVIIEMPWAYLDPRRPTGMLTAEHREEGLLQYTPELPLPAEAAINYNSTLWRTTAIHAAPARLESTCLVLAYGLDLFYTRVAPSKTFDLLKDDFDYYLITIVLAALILATYSTKYFASRKMLRQAWK